MKTSLKNQYTVTSQVLIAIVSAVLGCNIYQAIVHPEKSHLILSIILVMMTYNMVEKYGHKMTQQGGQEK
jgi:hypothetical protein